MNTTSLLIELIVIGSFGLIWIDPIIKYMFDFSIFTTKVFFSQYIFIPIVVIYFLGMCLNFISDIIFHKLDENISKNYGGKKNIQKLKSKIIVLSSEGANYIYKRRSIVRIFRANTINIFIICLQVCFGCNLVFLTGLSTPRWVVILLLLCIIITIFGAYIRTLKGYFENIKIAGEIINE